MNVKCECENETRAENGENRMKYGKRKKAVWRKLEKVPEKVSAGTGFATSDFL